jgi:hypothetical protein
MPDQKPQSDQQPDLPATVADADLRASHADRDKVVELLQEAAGDGRLSADELDDRLERALTARTYAELAPLTADLPTKPGAGVAPVVRAVAANVTPKDRVKIHVRGSSTERKGAWVVPKELDILSRGGSVTLNFTEAVITEPALRITADVRGGNLRLITGPDIIVDADDVELRGSNVKVPHPPASGLPVRLRIEITGTVRGGNITAGPPRPPRRTFWQWLRRAPRPRAITG